MVLEPIGHFRCDARYAYDAARQAICSTDNSGCVEMVNGHNFEQALEGLAGFSRIWLLYLFHQKPSWRPKVLPPRAENKVGVFATRAPHRPNPLGLSCVSLLAVQGRKLFVGPHDLLDGTPILDIKPYLPYADSFPDARCGWVDALEVVAWEVSFSVVADVQLAWLEARGEASIRAFLRQQLCEHPFDTARKRVRDLGKGGWEIAYRTWRIRWVPDMEAQTIAVEQVYSGYDADFFARQDDPYGDLELHRAFARAATGQE